VTQKIYGRTNDVNVLARHLGLELSFFQSIPLPDGTHGFVAEPYPNAHGARAALTAEAGTTLLPGLATPDPIGDDLAKPFAHLAITGEHATRHVARALHRVAGAHLFDPET